MVIFVAIILNILIAFATSRLAERRGRSPANWFLYGVLFGLFATAALFVLSPLTAQEKPSRTRKIAERTPPAIDSPVETFAEKEWFYINQEQEQLGPVAFSALQTAWETGHLQPSDYVWTEGMEEWQQVESILDMQSALGERPLSTPLTT